MQDIAAFRTQMSQVIGRLTVIQRLLVIGLGVGSLAAVIYLVTTSSSPNYQSAFVNLAPADAAVAVEKIKAAGIPYQLASNGTIIEVPADKVADTRLMLAAEGLPQGDGVGFEIFDKTNFGLTDFAQRVNYRRALEGELARTISRLESVEAARVHIVIPEPTLYSQEKKEPTASVVLQLKPGRKPTTAQIKGISHLVSGSIEGLVPTNLTIVDSNGVILNEATGAGTDGLQASTSQLELKQSVETTLEKSILIMLDRVLGPNKAAVKVTANLDFDKVESSAEIFSPDGAMPQVRSERKITDNQTNQGTTPGGVPGADANVAGYQAVQGESNSEREMADTTVNYELSKKVEKTVRAPGSIKTLAVAVVLDQQVPVADAQVDTIQQLVATAAGIDQKRGDLITVTALPFDRSLVETEQAAFNEAEQREQFMSYLRLGALVVVPLLVLIAFLIAVRMARRPPPMALVPAMATFDTAALPIVTNVITNEKFLQETKAPPNPVREQVEHLARQDPAVIAQLVRNWLQDDEHGR